MYKRQVTIRETTCNTGAATELPIEPLNDIVGADASPVFAGEIAAGESLLNTILYLFGCLLQFHRTKFFYDGFDFLPGSFLALLGVDCLSILATSFTLERGVTENTLREKCTVHRWYLASGNTSPTASSIRRHLSPITSFPPSKPRPLRKLFNLITVVAVSYTHLDVYKRQPSNDIRYQN